jgi:phosphatidylglycerophosphate synthase
MRSAQPSTVPDRGYAATLSRLAGAQKPAAYGSPAYSRFVNRRIGRYLAAAAYEAGLTPNQVTAVSALCSLSGIVAIATIRPSWWMGIAVALALALGYAFDSADGQLARLRGGGSPAGEWLDHVVDSAKICALHAAVLISFYRFFDLPTEALLLLPIGYQLVDTVAFFAITLNDQLKRLHGGGKLPSVTPSDVRSFLVLPTDYGVLCLAFALLGWQSAFLVGYGGLLAVNVVYLMAALVKWYRTMARLGRADRVGQPSPRDAE